MTDVAWEIVDTNNIEPKGNDGNNKNIVPRGTANVGTSSDRWANAFVVKLDASEFAKINTSMGAIPLVFIVYGDSGSTDANVLMGASATSHRVYLACSAMMSTDSDARTILAQENTEADIAVASFKQRNDSAPFLDFEGATASDASKNISTGNGNGSVVGPKAKNTASMGWTFDTMVKQRITPEAPGEPYDVWVPGFQPEV